jgi:large exoprotein involved in heme utilization and adhesion
VRNGAEINASFDGNEGHGGNVTVTADHVFLSGDGANFEGFILPTSTGIFASSSGVSAGLGVEAGNITVTAGSLEVRNGAVISAGGFTTEQGGSVTVTADHVFLSGDGANVFLSGDFGANEGFPIPTGIFANGEGAGAGRSGNITVTAGSLEVRNGAEINASFRGLGQGGNVMIEVGDLLHLSNGSRITASVAGGEGSGGNIAIDSVFVVLDEGSSIIANADRGQGGNIFIRILGGGALFQSPDSLIEASSELGLDGSVVIDAPDTNIIAGFAGLPANFLDAATVLTQLCAGRSGANVSSLVVRKYEVLPDSPYALRVQLPRAMPAPRTAKQSRTPRTYYAGSPLPPMISCLGNG